MNKNRVVETMKDWAVRIIRIICSRLRFLSLYLIFAGIALNGWYIDVVGWFSSSENYAASISAQYGDINFLNVLVFAIGTLAFLGYLWADVKNKRLEKMIVGDGKIYNRSVLGDANQAVTTGENSSAVNAPQGQVTINHFGITEERCRVIFDEKLPIALQNYSVESIVVAKERTYKFRQKLVPRLGKEENGYENFADPSFLFLLIEAQKAAASTEREADYDLLSELLATRAKMGTDRKLHMGINKAVNMLPYISDSQLAGITVEFCIAILCPNSNNMNDALSTINDCYGKILNDVELPMGGDWLESLESGGLVKNVNMTLRSFKKSREILLSVMEEYTMTGIRKGGESYQKALDIINSVNLPKDILIEHELNSDYVRLLPINKKHVDDIKLTQQLGQGITLNTILNETQRDGIEQIFALYEGEAGIREDFKNRFVAKYNEYPNLKKVTMWWDGLTSFFELTIVGRILANANANKCDARIPIIVR